MATLQIHQPNLWADLLAIGGIAQFLFCVAWAIDNYPEGYSFSEHFLSDLGRVQTANGHDNSSLSQLFSLTVVTLGVTLLPFFVLMPYSLDVGGGWLSCCGLVSAAGIIGIGLTPYDRFFVLHHVALGAWVVSMFVMVIAFNIIAHHVGLNSMLLTSGSVALIIVTLLYAGAGSHSAYVFMQKIFACFAIVWFAIVIASVSITTVHAIQGRRLIAEKQAVRYLARIQKGHRKK